jgi:glycosyltransferase involved in cell wall biosynthesis
MLADATPFADAPRCIALSFGTFPPQHNGGSDFLFRLARGLAAAGVRPIVLTSPCEGEPRSADEGGVSVRRIVDDWTVSAAGRRSLREAWHVLRDEGAELVHVVFPDSELDGRYQLPAALPGRLPLVTTFFNLGLGRRSPWQTRASSLALLARSSVLTSHDPGYLSHLSRLALGRPVRWLPVGSNVPIGDVEPASLDRGARWISYFGQLDATRGVDVLFRALVLLRGERDVRLLMIGSAGREERYAESDAATWAEYRRLRALPDELGLADAVEWTPYLPPEEVSALLRASDCCVLPYRRNSIGRSALAAALGLGVPVVLGGTADRVVPLRDGEHVLLAPPGDDAALARAVARVLDDDSERRRLSDGARTASRFFTWERIAAAAIDVYRAAHR